ncbi:unnamed protein product [Arctogadus glacialis]
MTDLIGLQFFPPLTHRMPSSTMGQERQSLLISFHPHINPEPAANRGAFFKPRHQTNMTRGKNY